MTDNSIAKTLAEETHNNIEHSLWSNVIKDLGPAGIKELANQVIALSFENIRLANLLEDKKIGLVNNLKCCCEDKREVTKNMEELKNCPFCGGKAISRRRRPDHIMNGKYFISCVECRNKTHYYDSEEEAIAAWNKRVEVIKDDINYCPHCGKKLS